ncbi:hypothetical protein HPY28_13020 [Brevibacillus sp. HB1.2]|uniref:hypothetical protein n=1 Tax=Brevibacillus sp. HB1.2 TaxID=2738807 RepID=UPI001575C797|nr:hypothetical protein [Brevibacillus sp. HB1.2]NTU21244.1 hypothetical protein [Brevibacillus sp. HB1.2]
MNENRVIQLHPLTFLEDKQGVLIGRFGTDTFAVFPEDGAALVRKLQEGMGVAEAHSWYQDTYHDEVDMDDFLQTLRDLTFICDVEEKETKPQKVSGQWLGKLAFSPLGWLIYVAIITCALWLLYQYPQIRPGRLSILFSEYAMVVFLGMTIGQIPGILFHEWMHMLAGRRLGIPSELSIGRRMYFLVFTSSMPGIWGFPKRKRVLPFLVGMFGDILWYSLLVIVAGAIWINTGEKTIIAAYCMGLAFTTLLRFFWQFYFHLQTDIYYLMITMLGCVNLQEATRSYLKNIWYGLIGKKNKMVDMSKYTERDHQVARWYSFFYATGWMMMTGMMLYMVPVAIQLLTNIFLSIFTGEDMKFWDSVVFLSITGVQYGIVFYLYLKERRNKREIRNLSMEQRG